MSIKKIILDTDLQSDCDDAGAIAALHALADLGECEILGMGVCSSAPFVTPCLRALNTFLGRPDLPIGTLQLRPGVLLQPNSNYYTESVAKRFCSDTELNAPLEDVVGVYRRLLAAQPDGSVTMVAIGFLRNFLLLLGSKPDEHSPLTGLELVRLKVNELVSMGGRLEHDNEEPEFNWGFDGHGMLARAVFQEWPTPITVTDGNLGKTVMTGERLRSLPETNVVRAVYETWFDGIQRFEHWYRGDWQRSSWDQTAVLYAVRGLGAEFGMSADGCVQIDLGGSSRWRPEPNRQHRYLKKIVADEQLAEVIEDLMIAAGATAL
jgi:inosine-uridine nucleoside N-ribohydrolase